ncbi:MAG: hypothetical protein IJ567_08885 [Lachnospiraceae bacterium]|nr:hypothetical protein [Lachnospiraceae bacterium]
MAMFKSFDETDAIYFLSFLNHFIEDPRLHRLLIELLQGNSLSPWINIMYEIQLIYAKDEYYREKKQLHQRNVERIRETLQQKLLPIPIEQRNKKRIVIITEQMGKLNHAPTRMIVSYVNYLRKMGYEILVCACPSNMELTVDQWYGKRSLFNSIEGIDGEKITLEYEEAKIPYMQVDLLNPSIEKYEKLYSLIYGYNPLFVWGMGIFNPAIDIVADFTTLVVKNMSNQCPISAGQIILRVQKRNEIMEKCYEENLNSNQVQCFIKNHEPARFKETGHVYCRKDEGLDENQFILAVVGNRLDTEVTEEFVDMLKEVMELDAHIAVAFIGEVSVIKKYFEDDKLKDRIYYMGYREDLLATLKMLDMYVNPKRSGGGWSGAMAAVAGMPVLTLPDCDVEYNTGEKAVVHSYDEMKQQILLCAQSGQYYEEKKNICMKYAERHGEEAYRKYMYDLIHQIKHQMEEYYHVNI